MKNFINRPIPRLLRYELLLKGILEETPVGPIAASNRQGGSLTSSRGANAVHEDHSSIPQVLDVIRRLGKDTEPGVVNAKSKVELWKYNEGLVFKQGEWIDMDLLAESRSLIHSGKLLRQTDGLEWSGWTELYVLLFDNYSQFPQSSFCYDISTLFFSKNSGFDEAQGARRCDEISRQPQSEYSLLQEGLNICSH